MSRSRSKWLATIVCLLFVISACVPGTPGERETPTPSSAPSTATTRPSFDAANHELPRPAAVYDDKTSPDRPTGEQGTASPPGFVDPPPGSGLARYFDQPLTWEDCGAYKCATFSAPLDWFAPDCQAITIAMKMSQATEGPYRGPLFINPGGPGGSSQDYVDGFRKEGTERFDIIGLDSRGSGQSTPVVCGTGPQTDEYYNADSTPDDQTERDALITAQMAFNEQCRENSGPLLDHITSIETIYDYDLARHLLGAEKFNFYGVSYGTFLGSVYAELYPERVGRMVLDSAVNLTPSTDVIQAQGFDLSMRNYADWCAGTEACPLGNTQQEVIDKVMGFLKGLDADPLPTEYEGRMLTESLATSGLVLYFYFDDEMYAPLTGTLAYTMESGDGTFLLDSADLMNERAADGSYGSLTYAFPAIRCVDEADEGVPAAFENWTGRDSQLAPIFGPQFGPDLVCPLWTAEPAPQIDFTGVGAPPLLVVQNTGDSATPYRNAEIMAEELESAVLVVRDSPGHGAFDSGSTCLDRIVLGYLVHGKVPADGTQCPS